MPISVDRIRSDIEAIARFTETPGHGATRPTFSRAWANARAYVIAQAEAAGCDVRTDAAGNLHARQTTFGWDAKAYLCGSHLDTVPHGGDYDGVAGVVTALELLRSAHDDGVTVPVELVVFAEEEGPAFGLGMLGSRAWVGDLGVTELARLKNAAGQTYLEAGQPYGVDPARLAADRLDPTKHLGLIEVHIEQGPGMWRRDQRLAIVTAIAGRVQARVTVTGEANHAGATAMADRRDALAAAAEMIGRIEELARDMGGGVVATVGRITAEPNAINVIANRVEFTVDLRAPTTSQLDDARQLLTAAIIASTEPRGVESRLTITEQASATPMDAKLIARLRKAAGDPTPVAVSGALHDSAILAPHVPTAMLFVPSRDGISHNPAEFSRFEDVALAAQVVERVVRRPTLAQLNAMPRDAFVAACGGLFEHSPWIAERAWPARPFASLADLHEKLTSVVRASTPDEQLSLIRAHPDLVGRLAREGRLTGESTSEQAAAGLSSLTPDEVAAFERYNAAYREKFGFPFVICARENKKDAIVAAMPRRLQNTRDAEIATALEEIYKIARLRLADAVWED